MRLDKSVASFVKTLNKIEGVYPASSCGGHERPKGSRCAIDEFFVIIKIRNQQFLAGLKKMCVKYRDVSSFEYHPLFKTWCLHGTHESKDYVYEPWINKYLRRTKEYKSQTQWEHFYSYLDEPDPSHANADQWVGNIEQSD